MNVSQVAVIMPCYNAAATLEQAVRSVFAQTFSDWELWIVDDGSSDGSPALLQRLSAEEARIRVLRNDKPSGAAEARNRALRECNSRYVAFLDSDDAWLPGKLTTQLKAMAEKGAALACGSYDVMDGEGVVVGQVRPTPGTLTYRSMLGNNSVGCLTAVLDRSQCGDVQFNSALPKGEDYHLWLSVLKRGLTGICLEETLGLYRIHGKTLSSNKFSAARNRWRVYREFEKHGLLTSAFYFTVYALSGVAKMIFMRRNRLLGSSGS